MAEQQETSVAAAAAEAPAPTTTTAPSATTTSEQEVRAIRKKDSLPGFDAPGKYCIHRIHTDLKHLARDPVDGIFVVPDETLVNVCHALVIGPADTPYEYGFFYFVMEFPNSYPLEPPRVTLKTTGGGAVSLNPNLYKDGKVCLSILGTWSGPCWTPANSIGSVLLSIRSLLGPSPYHNEPGFEDQARGCPESVCYNRCIRHETLRIAVLDMVDLARFGNLPSQRLTDLVCSSFVDCAEIYKYTCDEYSFLDKQPFQDPHGRNRGTFQFSMLKKRIEQLEEELGNRECNSSSVGED